MSSEWNQFWPPFLILHDNTGRVCCSIYGVLERSKFPGSNGCSFNHKGHGRFYFKSRWCSAFRGIPYMLLRVTLSKNYRVKSKFKRVEVVLTDSIIFRGYTHKCGGKAVFPVQAIELYFHLRPRPPVVLNSCKRVKENQASAR